jgi:transcriptional regulator
MYIPKAFHHDQQAELVAFMQANSFATLVSILDGVPFASHIPLVITIRETEVILTGHLAKANPHWQAFAGAETLAIFTGPHAYISPSLYEKHESVPTWNYIAVHAYGQPSIRRLDDSHEAIEQMLAQMIGTYDPGYQAQWQSLPERYRVGMMQGIVAFDMVVAKLEGKAKLSQNRSHLDQVTVSQALVQSQDSAIRGVGEAMQAHLATQAQE